MAVIDPQSPVARTTKRRFRAPLVWAAGGWLILMVIVSIFANWLMPFDFMAMDLRNRLGAPVFQGGEWAHPLGSDHLGRDILSRLVIATRVSILIALFGDADRRRLSASPWASSRPISAAGWMR